MLGLYGLNNGLVVLLLLVNFYAPGIEDLKCILFLICVCTTNFNTGNIGIKHDFLCINICWAPRVVL